MNSASRPARPTHRGLWLMVATTLLAAGCSTPMDPRKDSQLHSAAYTTDRPVVRPTRSVSSFSDSLMCMDHMLRAAQLPTTLITSKQVVDYSSRVPVAVKDMIITSLSQMSRLSNAFRYVDYEVDIVRQDTVQNLTTILLNNNQMQLQRPALYVSGAIAFVDQNVVTNRFGAGTSASRLDTGYSSNRTATVIGLEMHLGDFRTRTLIPGLDSANEVVIGGGGQGLDVAGRIGSYGVNFNVGRDYALGTGGAMRTLVDLATVELVGKWARVPYWQCLTLEQNHPDFQRQMRDWFAESGGVGQARLVQSSLIAQGYLQAGADVLAMDSPALRTALAQFQVDNLLVPTGVLDFSTYERAMRHFVALAADGSLQRVGWGPSGPTSTLAQAAPVRGAARGLALTSTEGLPRRIDMQIENTLPPGVPPTFEVGEQVFASVTVSRTSHLYCYFSDPAGNVMRLTPNNVNTHSLVGANQAVRLPDWMVPNPAFVMDATSPGVERVACYASDDDALARLPAPLQGAGLVTVPGYRGLEDIDRAFTQGLGEGRFSRAELNWQVVPRKAPPPAAPQPAPASAAR
ncbi:DUF4384 domain-containing protein [Pulveribacter suum]|uniref:Peptidoglycan-binding protein n=1 Tax=Pulveribacter suum TaxID=2116657 RepID=A0A2P1NL28_9BURK|nr:DUF4384 domain-containing protein [Pulveribacter suum]AVP57741.1 peptidoglycan-binding protein [Pulveribacter suum]